MLKLISVLTVLLVIIGNAKLPHSGQQILFLARESVTNDPELYQPVAALTVCVEGPPACQFSRIQEAIDVAPSYSRIFISPGEYYERLTITKSLSLYGTGPSTIIQLPKWPEAAIVVGSLEKKPGNLQVVLAHLTIQLLDTSSTGTLSLADLPGTGILVHQQAGTVTLQHVNIRGYTGPLGIVLGVAVHILEGNMLQIVQSFIQDVSYGILAWEPNALTLIGMRVENVITALDVSQGVVFISDTEVSQARLYGLLADEGHVFINRSQFKALRRGYGIQYGIHGSRLKVLLINETHIEGFRMAGVIGEDIEQLSLKQVVVIQNGFGVVLKGATRLTMQDSIVAENQEWGVAHAIKGCYGQAPMIIPGVEVLGSNNEIPDRDEAAGNHKGALCPPDYPWPPGFRK